MMPPAPGRLSVMNDWPLVLAMWSVRDAADWISGVCIENSVRVDYVSQSPHVRAMIALFRLCLAFARQVTEASLGLKRRAT
jgi:hypothetical protein